MNYKESDGDYTNIADIIRIATIAKQQSQLTDQRLYDPADDPELGKFFKKKEIFARDDYPEWRSSCFKQLDQYQTQGMFSDGVTTWIRCLVHALDVSEENVWN